MVKDLINLETRPTKAKERLYYISVIVFWGAIWGIAEASLGYFLHLLSFKFPTGSIMFPIGFLCMQNVYKATGSIKNIFYTSVISALIKLINFLMPAIPTIRVLNPAGCILFEGLAVAAIYYVFKYKEGTLKLGYPLLMSVFWRIGYYTMCFAIFIPSGMMESSSILNMNHFMNFFLINGFINALLIYSLAKFMAKKDEPVNISYSPLYSISMFLLALMLQWIT